MTYLKVRQAIKYSKGVGEAYNFCGIDLGLGSAHFRYNSEVQGSNGSTCSDANLLMTAQIVSVTLFFLLGLRAAFPQATAEAGLLNGNSAVGGKVTTAFGNALNRSVDKIAGQVSNMGQPKAEVRKCKPVTRSAPPFSGPDRTKGPSMIKSIQGGRATHPSAHRNSPNG